MLINGIALCVLEIIQLSTLDPTTKPLEYVHHRLVEVKDTLQEKFGDALQQKIIQALSKELDFNTTEEFEVVLDPSSTPPENCIVKNNVIS